MLNINYYNLKTTIFQCSKHYGSMTRVTMWKVPQNMADRPVIKNTARCLQWIKRYQVTEKEECYPSSIRAKFSVYTACVNKSASLKEHFFLRKRYVSFVKVYNNMIGNLFSFYRIFVLCNLDLWFGNYGKSCEVPPNLFGLIH